MKIGQLDYMMLYTDPFDQFEWIIFGKDYCPYTKHAINDMIKTKMKGVYISVMDDSMRENKKNMFYYMNDKRVRSMIRNSSKPDHKTYPAIFHNKVFIGGYDELKKYMIGLEKSKQY